MAREPDSGASEEKCRVFDWFRPRRDVQLITTACQTEDMEDNSYANDI